MSYDPEIGRWLEEDPIGYPDGLNRYAMESSSPVMQVDPLGLWGRPFREWQEGNAYAIAGAGDTPTTLGRAVTGREIDAATLSDLGYADDFYSEDQEIDVEPLIKHFEELVRQASVKATGKFDAPFGGGARSGVDAASVKRYFENGNVPDTDCISATVLSQKMGLLEVIGDELFDALSQNFKISTRNRAIGPDSPIRPGDRMVIRNNSKYDKKFVDSGFSQEGVMVVDAEKGLFWGHPDRKAFTEKEWERKLVEEFNNPSDERRYYFYLGCSVSIAYPNMQITNLNKANGEGLQNSAHFFDMYKIAMAVFDAQMD